MRCLVALILVSGCWAAPRAKFATGYLYSYYVPQSASTPWRPAWSPDGKYIAFAMSGSIWKIAVGDSTAYELTANPTYDSSPAWSPDGRWIVYTAEDSQGVNIMLLDLKTGESTALTRGGDIHLDPVFSPDGRQLAWVTNKPGNTFHVYVVNFDQGKIGPPALLTTPNSFGRPRLYFSVNDDHISPCWSPDGKELLLVSNRGIPLGSGGIWRAPVEPDAMSKARLLLREETLYRTQPQWSPDGKRILYSSHRGSQYNNLYVLPAAGGEPYQLTFGDFDHFDPRWSPDGEWIAYISNQNGLSDLRLLKTFGGEERKVEIRRRVYRRPMGTLHVRIQGAARFYLTGADGKSYTPPTAFQRVAGRHALRDFFHAEGEFTVDLPPGEAILEAARGIEYFPIQRKIPIRAGAVTLTEIDLKPLTRMKALGWWSGSDHVHLNYGGNLHNTPENLLFMARAEDLAMVGEKIANKDHRVFDVQYFEQSRPHRLSTAEHLLTFNQEYRPPFYGHVNFINLTQHLISPFTTGYEGSAIESLYPSNTDVFRMARAQGALGGYVHPFTSDPVKMQTASTRGYAIDLALETFDYLEVLTSAQHMVATGEIWHRSLNCGFKVTASAGEDSILGLHATPILGSSRIYAYLGDRLEWSRWVDAIRKGRTIVTNGPLLRVEVDGRIPGDEIHLPDSGGEVQLTARVDSIVPLEKLEVFLNGKVVERIAVQGNSAEIHKKIPITRSAWLTVRASNSQPQHPIDDSFVIGESGPIYIYTGKRPIRSRQDAEYFLRFVDETIQQAEQHPGWRSEKEKQHVFEQFRMARQVFAQRAAEAR
ncbi:MAG: CehA/McbA family metallohydrolase [Bryobacteraceae bacterium]|nr:CehA/McbA family metallohydrolase [Bryobacteraceae bacterium]MDW8378046.1 CehA/McbA family metallohydrolase [Bryobacterales bacterium]